MNRRHDNRQDEADLDAIWNAAGIVFLLAVGFLVGFGAAVLMGVF